VMRPCDFSRRSIGLWEVLWPWRCLSCAGDRSCVYALSAPRFAKRFWRWATKRRCVLLRPGASQLAFLRGFPSGFAGRLSSRRGRTHAPAFLSVALYDAGFLEIFVTAAHNVARHAERIRQRAFARQYASNRHGAAAD